MAIFSKMSMPAQKMKQNGKNAKKCEVFRKTKDYPLNFKGVQTQGGVGSFSALSPVSG